jgi:hypothetical protein
MARLSVEHYRVRPNRRGRMSIVHFHLVSLQGNVIIDYSRWARNAGHGIQEKGGVKSADGIVRRAKIASARDSPAFLIVAPRQQTMSAQPLLS